MRLLILAMAALVAAGPPLQPDQQTGQSAKGAAPSKPSQPSPPVYYKPPEKNHGHPTDNSAGTPPCGTRGSDCPAPKEGAPSPSHTGRDVAIGAGVGLFAGAVIGSLAHTEEPVNKLNRNGPQFPGTVHMSLFQVTGFVKGGWPLVLDYEAIAPTYAVLIIVTQNAPAYSVLLPTGETGRRNVIVRLPPELGTEL